MIVLISGVIAAERKAPNGVRDAPPFPHLPQPLELRLHPNRISGVRRQPLLKAPEVLLDNPQDTDGPVRELRHNVPHLAAHPRDDFLNRVRARTRAASLQAILLSREESRIPL